MWGASWGLLCVSGVRRGEIALARGTSRGLACPAAEDGAGHMEGCHATLSISRHSMPHRRDVKESDGCGECLEAFCVSWVLHGGIPRKWDASRGLECLRGWARGDAAGARHVPRSPVPQGRGAKGYSGCETHPEALRASRARRKG